MEIIRLKLSLRVIKKTEEKRGQFNLVGISH